MSRGAGMGGTAAPPNTAQTWLSLRAADHALDEPVHRVEVLDGQALPGRHAQLAALVVERALELVELARGQCRLLRRDRRLRLGRHGRAVRRDADEVVLEVSVVEAGLPGAVHRGLDAAEVVRAPVVHGCGEPRLRRELLRVGVVADPW